MNGYTFCFTEKELKEFSIRAVAEQYRRRGGMWVILLLLCVLEAFVSPLISVCILLCFAAALGVDMFRTYRFMKNEHFLEKRSLRVEDGLLKCSAGGAGEIPCGRINVVIKTRNLLMLGYAQSKRQLAWYPLPLRVFGSETELEQFLSLFGRPEEREAPWNTGEGQAQAGAVFSFVFQMDEEKWIRVYKEALMTVKAGTLGFPQDMKTCLGVYGTAYVVAVLIWFFKTGDHTPVFPAVLLLLFLYLLLYRWKADPEKNIRRQIRNGGLQNDIYGNWELYLLEEGIVQIVAGRSRTFFRWEEFGWLVETPSVFYLFKKNKLQFIPILKEGIQSFEQAGAMCRFCESKGAAGMGGKRLKYLPGWFFGAGLALLTAALFLSGIWLGYYRDRQRQAISGGNTGAAEEGWQEGTFNPADYPDYVPLDEQVRVLRSFDFPLTDSMTESARGMMQEEITRIYIEGYPYTWLLTELGAPDRDENGRITAYSEEVFWFDFEGFDISTDYIEVLEGMLALAGDGPLSDVTNIREDTGGVNWEKGSGSVKVMLEWNGLGYAWDMKAEYDWIDSNVLGILNELLALEQPDTPERFYVIGDNGQGALVFYCTAEWAEAFGKATGLEPEAPAASRP